jgi:hypothetical protein
VGRAAFGRAAVGAAGPTAGVGHPAASAATRAAVPTAAGAAPETEPVSAAAIDPAHERDLARKILDGRRYKGSPVPRPLHGVLSWIGDRFSPIGRWIGDRFSWLPDWSRPWVVGALGIVAGIAVVAVLSLATARALERGRVAREGDGTPRGTAANAEDPDALERAAAEAEAAGDLELAVRLRFRAGLLRLDRDAHAIAYRPSIGTAAVRSELGSPAFDALADRFERIAYGGDDADTTDSEDARKEWPRVVAAARKR